MKLSVIIPTYNEAGSIEKLLLYLKNSLENATGWEIIVVDGQSPDGTYEKALSQKVTALWSPNKGRAAQMNYGASQAQGEVLYFLHADSFPPNDFFLDINIAVGEGYEIGCYRLAFDYTHWFLSFNSWFTRFDIDLIRFGDQSLFVTREIFTKDGGFDEKLLIMEDAEIIPRLRKFGKFKVLSKFVTTSARKYLDNGIYRLQGIFFLIYFLFKLGVSQHRLIKIYKGLIKQSKI